MIFRDLRVLLGVAGLLLVIGLVIPMLMVLRILESTYFLNFFSYIASFLGLILGFIGVTNLLVKNKRK
jgi:hypothetical protein